MASLKEFGLPGIGTGILHPAMSHRWRVLIADCKALTMQTTRVELDMLNSEATLYIEQPIVTAQDMLDDIRDLGRRGEFDFRLQLLDGRDTLDPPPGEVRGFAKLIKHEFVLDYALDNVATHVLKLRYTPAA